MTAYNIVRMRVKPGHEKDFHDKNRGQDWKGIPGFRKVSFIDIGERTFIVLGEWENKDTMMAAMPSMVGMLNDIRDMLEDLGGDLGVTDPSSGEAVIEIS